MSGHEKQFFESLKPFATTPPLNSSANLGNAKRVLADTKSSEKKKEVARLLLQLDEAVKRDQEGRGERE